MSPRTGRPPKVDSGIKALRLEIRLNKEELDKIQACADRLGLSRAETILKAIELLSEQLEK